MNHPNPSPPPVKKPDKAKIILLSIGGIILFLVWISACGAILDDNPPVTSTPSPTCYQYSEPHCEPVDEATTEEPTEEETTKAPKPKPAPAKPTYTDAQEQAIGSAEDYLEYSAFSRKGLIRQLSSDAGEGFAKKDAIFAVDHIKVNWNEQAAKSAKEYLEYSHFSRSGLIRHLESDAGEGFTHSQAVYGVNAAGL
jgi:hypothetical protein